MASRTRTQIQTSKVRTANPKNVTLTKNDAWNASQRKRIYDSEGKVNTGELNIGLEEY